MTQTEIDGARCMLQDMQRLEMAVRRLTVQRDTLLVACKLALEQMRHDNESEAHDRAIDAELGVSEWEAFMPAAWHRCRGAIALVEGET